VAALLGLLDHSQVAPHALELDVSKVVACARESRTTVGGRGRNALELQHTAVLLQVDLHRRAREGRAARAARPLDPGEGGRAAGNVRHEP
jgi:hypothetical protein